MTEEKLSQEELNKLLEESYEAARNDRPLDIKQMTESGEVVPEKIEEPEPEEEAPLEEEQAPEAEEPAEQEAPEKEEEDQPNELAWLQDLDEDKRALIEFRLKQEEEARKKLEVERRAAVGRTAYLQRKQAELEKALSEKGSKPGNIPAFTPPKTPEEWNALAEADPQAAKALEAYVAARDEAREKWYEDRLNQEVAPLKQYYQEQQSQQEQWKQQQVQMVYEAHPDFQEVVKTDEWGQWTSGMEQQWPGFTQYLQSVNHAFGDESHPGLVDLFNLFHYHLNERNSQPPPQQPSAEATKVLEERNKKINQAPTLQRKPQAVTTAGKEFDPEKELERAFQEAKKELGL